MMDDTFDLIQYLTVARHKGVIIWLLNIGAEKYWNKLNQGIVDKNEDMIVNRVEEMNLLLCREQDVMILREMPDPIFLSMLQKLGFSVPRIWIPENADLITPIAELVLKDEQIQSALINISREEQDVYFVPYAVTYIEEQIAEKCGLHIIASPSAINAMVNDKIFNRAIAQKLNLHVCLGNVCSSVEEISQEYDRLVNHSPFFEKIIIKEPHGASGKGLYIIENKDSMQAILGRIARQIRNNPDSKWLVEGWYHKKKDINYQIYISPTGLVDMFSIKEQVLKDTVYIGSKMPADLSEEVIHSYKNFGEVIGKYLFELGYTGVAGIDSIITDDDKIIPIIEINGRFTLSTYISFMEYIVGKRKIFSRYFKIISETPFGYEAICKALDQEGILYDESRGEGVIVYTSGTLPSKYEEGKSIYQGRLFTLIVSKDWELVHRYSSQLDAFMDAFSNRILV